MGNVLEEACSRVCQLVCGVGILIRYDCHKLSIFPTLVVLHDSPQKVWYFAGAGGHMVAENWCRRTLRWMTILLTLR